MKLRLQRSFSFEELEVATRPIFRAEGPMAPPPEVARVTSARYARPFGTDRQDSRVDVDLPALDWKVEWRLDLEGRYAPQFILDGGDRLFMQSGDWRILDLTGQPVSKDGLRLGPGRAVIADGLVHIVDTNGFISAYALADGQKSFSVLPALGEAQVRPFIARRGAALIAVGTELARNPHSTQVPTASLLQRIGLGDPIRADASGLIQSVTDDTVLHIDRQPLVAAMSGDTVVVAVPGHLLHVKETLEVAAVFADARINPVSLSVDEALRSYVVVDTGHASPRALWVIDAEGGVPFHVPLPADMKGAVLPPLVARDHRVFVVSNERVVALDAAGKLLWQRVPSGPVGGAIVTGDGQLLVAEGERIMRYALDQDHRLIDLQGEVLTTPPTLTPDGRIYVASKQRLFCLTPQG